MQRKISMGGYRQRPTGLTISFWVIVTSDSISFKRSTTVPGLKAELFNQLMWKANYGEMSSLSSDRLLEVCSQVVHFAWSGPLIGHWNKYRPHFKHTQRRFDDYSYNFYYCQHCS